MNDTTLNACQCVTCPGASCGCGCRQPVAQNACACGAECTCGSACACPQA